MKTYFKSSELPHIWANLTPAEIKAGRSGKCPSSETFRGADYYSYWAVIGRHVTSRGQHGFIVSRKGYSVTTSSHQSGVAQAVSGHANVFEVGTWANISGREVYADIRSRIDAKIAAASTARSRAPYHLEAARNLLADLQRANEFFGLRRKPYAPDLAELTTKTRERAKLAAARDFKAAQKERELTARFGPKALDLWHAGKKSGDPEVTALYDEAKRAGLRSIKLALTFPRDGDFKANSALRLNADKSRVETSGGAQVLVRTVGFLWPICAKARADGLPVSYETIQQFPKLDNYNVSGIDSHGNLTVGCHAVPFSELAYIAHELNLPAASEAAELVTA